MNCSMNVSKTQKITYFFRKTTILLVFILMSTMGLTSAHSQEKTTGDILIYNSRVTLLMPTEDFKGVPVLWRGEPTKESNIAQFILNTNLITPEVTHANQMFEKVQNFFYEKYGRRGFDDQASMVQVGVNVNKDLPFDLGMKENAAWLPHLKMFVFGDGTNSGELNNFIYSIEIVAHEYTHSIVNFTSDLQYIGQSGALNEHFADVFGAAVRKHYEPQYSYPFLIGDNALTSKGRAKAKSLRDMENPNDGLVWQPKTMNEIPSQYGQDCAPSFFNDNCGVHILSGIPNKIFTQLIKQWGWEKTRNLYYKVMTERLNPMSQFADYKNAILNLCKEQELQFQASDCEYAETVFKDVGL